MKVLIFYAAVSALANTAMTEAADEIREAGHHVGLRSLPSFRREPEPAELVVVALTDEQASAYRVQLTELVAVFGTEKLKAISLPKDDKELLESDWATDLVSELSDDKGVASGMSLDQLRAEAVLRGLEVRADSTAGELAHLLDIDHDPSRQAAERRSDRQPLNPSTEQFGLRTSGIMPSVNGLDLQRLNDEQLKAAAAEMGVRHAPNAGRETIIKKMTAAFETATGAPSGSIPDPNAGGVPPFGDGEGERPFDDGLEGLDEEGLKKVATDESIDLGRTTTVDGMKTKIVEARKEQSANQE